MPLYAVFQIDGLGAHSSLLVAPAGANNDFNVVAKAIGEAGDDITVAIVVAGNSTALSVDVTGTDIVLNSATNGGGTATTTANEAIAALLADEDAAELVDVFIAAGSTGATAVAAVSETPLAGGVDKDLGATGGRDFTFTGMTTAQNDEDAISNVADDQGGYVAVPAAVFDNNYQVLGSPPFARSEVIANF